MNDQNTQTNAFVQKKPWKRTLLGLVKLLIFAVLIVFVVRELMLRFATISFAELHFNYAILVPAAVLQMLPLFIVGWAYYILMDSHSPRISWLTVCAVTAVCRMGKYLPGKFASTAGAVWLFHRQGLPVALATRVTLMTQGLMVVLGLITAVPLTIFFQPVRDRLPLAWLWCVLLIAAGIVCLHPKIFCRLENFVLARLRQPLLPYIGRIRNYLAPVSLLVISQIVSGLVLWLTIRSVTDFPIALIPLCISAVALAGTIGLLALFAPAGLGVREWILLIILGPVVGPGISAVVVVLARLIHTIVELIVAVFGLFVLHRTASGRKKP